MYWRFKLLFLYSFTGLGFFYPAFSQNPEKLDPWYAENLADCKKILAKEGEGQTKNDPQLSDSRIFSICSDILTSRVLETPAPKKPIESGGIGSDISTGLFYIGAAAEWVVSLGITENLVERAIRREIPKEIYEAFRPADKEIQRKIVKPRRLQLFEAEGEKISKSDRKTRDALRREYQRKVDEFVEAESKKTIEKILPEVARWVVKEAPGGAFDTGAIRAKLTWKIAQEISAKNLVEMGYSRSDSLNIAENAMRRLENCFNQATALSDNAKSERAVESCGEKYSAAAPALLAESILMHELKTSLGGMISDGEIQEIASVVRVSQIKCISSKQKPTDSLEAKVEIAKSCSMEAVASSFQTILSYAINSQITKLSKPDATDKPGILPEMSKEEREDLIKKSLRDFLAQKPKKDNPYLKNPISPSKLIDLHKDKNQAELTQTIGNLNVDQFKLNLKVWQNHILDRAGKNIIEAAIKNNPEIQKALKANKDLIDRIANKTISEAYEPCMQGQADRGVLQLNPENCTSVVVPVAAAMVASAAIDTEFGALLEDLGLTTEKIKNLRDANIRSTEICVQNLARYLNSNEARGNDGLADYSVRYRVNQCIIPGLKTYMAIAAENVVRDNIESNPDIKDFFPESPAETEELLRKYGIIERAKDLSQRCFLTGIEEIHVSNLQNFLNQRKIICQSFIERSLSGDFSKIIASGLQKSSVGEGNGKYPQELRGRLGSHVRFYEENFSKKSEEEFYSQLRNHFGVKEFSNLGKTAESEKAAIDEIGERAIQLDKKLNSEYAKARRNLRAKLVTDVTELSLKSQIEHMIPSPDGQKAIYEKVMVYALPAQEEIVKNYQKLNELEAEINLEKDPRKKLELERQRNSLQLKTSEMEITYEGEVMHRATELILPLKLEDSLRHEVPGEARYIAETANEFYLECVGQKRLADAAVLIRLKNQTLARRHRMSAPIKPKANAPSPFSAKAVEECKNLAVAKASWMAIAASVDRALTEQLPDEFERIKKMKPPLSKDNCPVPAQKYSEQLSQAYANFLCYEDPVKKCITNIKSETDPPTTAGSTERIDYCLAKVYVKTAAPFAEIVLDKEFRKYLMLDTDPEKHKDWPSTSAHNYAEFIYSVSKVKEKFNKCAEKVDLAAGEVGSLADQKIKLDACAAAQVLTVARGAGYFATDAYSSLAHVDSKKRADAFRNSSEEFSKCMDQVERDLRQKAPEVKNPDNFYEIFVQLKMDPKKVMDLVSECTTKLEKTVGDYVFKGFVSRGQVKQREVKTRFRQDFDRKLALARIEAGFQTAVGILEASKKFSPPSKTGPAHPRAVRDSLDLVDKLVTDVCIYDENCRDTIGSLNVALYHEGTKTKTIPDKRFTEIVLNSSFFEKVILSRVQDTLRNQLESSFKPMFKYRNIIAEEMVDYLSGSRYLNQRFSNPSPLDPFGKTIPSGRSIIEKARNNIKAFYLNGDKSKDPEGPEFEKQISREIENYLVNDWEFLAGIFWAIAGEEVQDTPLPDGFFQKLTRDGASLIGAWENQHKTDWWGRGVRTPSGCKIMKKVQKLVADSFAGKPMPSSGPEMDKIKKEFTALYEASVEEGVWYGSSVLGRLTSEDWVEPSDCLKPPKQTLDESKKGH